MRPIYFKHDINPMNDMKLKRLGLNLRNELKPMCMGLYWHIIEVLNCQNGSMDPADIDLVGSDVFIPPADSKEILKVMLEVGLFFLDKDGMLHSKRTDRDLLKASEKCETNTENINKRWEKKRNIKQQKTEVENNDDNDENGGNPDDVSEAKNDDNADTDGIRTDTDGIPTEYESDTNRIRLNTTDKSADTKPSRAKVIAMAIANTNTKAIQEKDRSAVTFVPSDPACEKQQSVGKPEQSETSQPNDGTKPSSPQERPDDDPVAFRMPLLGGKIFPAKSSYVESKRQLYPGLDIDQQFRCMVSWLADNPRGRPASDMMRFVTTWLNKEQGKLASIGIFRTGGGNQTQRKTARDVTDSYNFGQPSIR